MQLKAKEPQAKLLFAITSPMVCNLATDKVVVGLRRIVALYHRSSASYQIH
jgi:hypothetical protein